MKLTELKTHVRGFANIEEKMSRHEAMWKLLVALQTTSGRHWRYGRFQTKLGRHLAWTQHGRKFRPRHADEVVDDLIKMFGREVIGKLSL